MEWLLSDAEKDFSKIVESALADGPQAVRSAGGRTVIVVSAEEYDTLKGAKRTLVDDLLSGPPWDDEFVEFVNARSKEPGRDIDL